MGQAPNFLPCPSGSSREALFFCNEFARQVPKQTFQEAVQA